ncbi:hypothetical protein MSAN_00623800 [Mycena sanguinolenta]|uniref:Uncharacterized protein n=1 Tax=Mycena sanguinolenta TaxID=230812 RepID=A0A8H7DEE1_9AGAR|nr:hypothetical protein MSAN_00623800 [Mycena sanguinolenta]
MLLILIAVHLLSQDSIAAPLPRPPDARATTDSYDDINNSRTIFSIVWGCLATIFACTWVSVHPNVPPPNQSRLQLFWRRLKMMLITMIAPEVIVAFAARQFVGSRWLVKNFNFSSTQAFFFCMGGFVSPTGYPIATMVQLRDLDLGSELQKAIQNVNDKEIVDKSKGDALSKGVVLLQGLWFILQCLARAHQHLAITQLEVATLAFAIVNVFIWLLWWNKPLDVQHPIVVGPRTLPDSQTIDLVQVSLIDRIGTAIVGFRMNDYHPLSSISVPSFWSIDNDDTEAHILLVLVGTLFGAVHCVAWNANFPTPAEMWIWRTSSVVITVYPGLTSLFALLIDMTELESVNFAVSIIVVLATFIYIAARIILIVLPLVELRSLPASALVDINWSAYIPPHMTSSFHRYVLNDFLYSILAIYLASSFSLLNGY